MSEAFTGEIRMFAGTYAPENWAFCNGQLLNIAGNEALFSLIGTTYGGDGRTTFGLPDLRGRVPLHIGTYAGNTYTLGQKSGTETVTLQTGELPSHTHPVIATSDPATSANPAGNTWATTSTNLYSNAAAIAPSVMDPSAISSVGGSQLHDNMMPSLTISFIINVSQGTFPPRP
ncbi:phage tail protein [Paenibacillus sp. WLX1005]|uniref:phage tail protein n=1 Tax=Paenibacillus sp. WLX1005 TaxID=3243766 RepID=UPI003983DC12